jgi:hypothetical protein
LFAFSRLQRSIEGHYLGIERSLEVRGLYLAEISLVEVRIALKHSNWRVQAVRGYMYYPLTAGAKPSNWSVFIAAVQRWL